MPPYRYSKLCLSAVFFMESEEPLHSTTVYFQYLPIDRNHLFSIISIHEGRTETPDHEAIADP